MTVDGLLSAVCEYFNGREAFASCPFIKAPVNAAAPVGNYVAVRAESVEQDGSMMEPAPGDGAAFAFQQVATVAMTEVEGDGENLRKARNLIQTREFRDAMAENFAVWELSQIIAVDTFDGELYVRQWRFTFTANFADEISTDVPAIGNVEPINLQGE